VVNAERPLQYLLPVWLHHLHNESVFRADDEEEPPAVRHAQKVIRYFVVFRGKSLRNLQGVRRNGDWLFIRAIFNVERIQKRLHIVNARLHFACFIDIALIVVNLYIQHSAGVVGNDIFNLWPCVNILLIFVRIRNILVGKRNGIHKVSCRSIPIRDKSVLYAADYDKFVVIICVYVLHVGKRRAARSLPSQVVNEISIAVKTQHNLTEHLLCVAVHFLALNGHTVNDVQIFPIVNRDEWYVVERIDNWFLSGACGLSLVLHERWRWICIGVIIQAEQIAVTIRLHYFLWLAICYIKKTVLHFYCSVYFANTCKVKQIDLIFKISQLERKERVLFERGNNFAFCTARCNDKRCCYKNKCICYRKLQFIPHHRDASFFIHI